MFAQSVEKLTAAQVASLLDSGDAVLVDTLPPEHFEARHIPGAVNACVYEVGFLDAMAEAVPDKGMRVVCYGAGPKSQDCFAAADKLSRAGYTSIAVFPEGLEGWRDAGFSLDGTAADTVEPPHPVLSLESRRYSVVPAESIIRWTGRNNNGGHHGTLMLSDGYLQGGDELEAAFTVDMTTIRNLDLEGDELKPVLEAHLASDDFFFTTMFPEATFTTTKIRLVEEGEATRPNAMLQGELVMRGFKNEIAFPCHIRNIDEGRLAVIANLDFDRTHWGVVYGSSRFFQHLSYHVVFDFISIDFRLVLA